MKTRQYFFKQRRPPENFKNANEQGIKLKPYQ